MATFKLGRYEITSRIASGGMATVYRANLQAAGGFAREFALKVIHPHLVDTPGFIERFLDEARVASRVRHPNVVTTVDVDEDCGYHFLVLELIDGVTLRQLGVVRQHPLAAAEAARVVADAARGLHAVHVSADERGESLEVVHRDLSPHNLMLDTTGRTVLIDLGLAKSKGRLGHTETGVLAGKLPYMSPEQSLMLPLDARSDVFSLGSVLFELCVGEAPFGDDHSPSTLERIRNPDLESIETLLHAAHVADWMITIVLGCLRLEPSERFSSAEALENALVAAIDRAGCKQSEVRSQLAAQVTDVKTKIPTPPLEPLPTRIRSNVPPYRTVLARTPFVIAGAVVVALAVFGGSRLRARSVDAAGLEVDHGTSSVLAPPRSIPDARPVTTRGSHEQGDEATAEAEAEEAEDTETSKKRRKRSRSRLKQNPYD